MEEITSMDRIRAALAVAAASLTLAACGVGPPSSDASVKKIRIVDTTSVMALAGTASAGGSSAALSVDSTTGATSPTASAAFPTVVASASSTAPVGGTTLASGATSPFTLVEQFISGTRVNADVHSYCLLFANSAHPPNADQPPLQPYDATNLETCDQDTDTTDPGTQNWQIGRVAIQGAQALVSLVGKNCADGTCASNTDPNLGMPGPQAGDFTHAFEAAVADGGGSVPVLACQEIAGRWYVLNDDNDS